MSDEAKEPLVCVECGATSEEGKGWRALRVDLYEIGLYCPVCAEREFGSKWEGRRSI